jgi:quercetin dioxygenase-like cupin family protein
MQDDSEPPKGTDLGRHPVHLGLGATAEPEPLFTGETQWYEDYLRRRSADGRDARLVSQFTFAEPWNAWEMHPEGAEVVLCTAGSMTLLQERPDGSIAKTVLRPGEYAINPAGTWHTADTDGEATAVFITAGVGTQHRPRT